jgi:toxin-antitoxin system PIN domain toxin
MVGEDALGTRNGVDSPGGCSCLSRISTNPRVFPAPLSIDAALRYVEEWITLPMVKTTSPGETHWPVLSQFLQQTGSGGNLTTDAPLAALALERGATVYSADNDFKRFAGIRYVNPFKNL